MADATRRLAISLRPERRDDEEREDDARGPADGPAEQEEEEGTRSRWIADDPSGDAAGGDPRRGPAAGRRDGTGWLADDAEALAARPGPSEGDRTAGSGGDPEPRTGRGGASEEPAEDEDRRPRPAEEPPEPMERPDPEETVGGSEAATDLSVDTVLQEAGVHPDPPDPARAVPPSAGVTPSPSSSVPERSGPRKGPRPRTAEPGSWGAFGAWARGAAKGAAGGVGRAASRVRPRIGEAAWYAGVGVAVLSLAAMAWTFLVAPTSAVPLLGVLVRTWVLLSAPAVLGIAAAAAGHAAARTGRWADADQGPRTRAEFEAEVVHLTTLGPLGHAARVAGVVLLAAGVWMGWSQPFMVEVRGVLVAPRLVAAVLAGTGALLVVGAQAVQASRARLRDRVLLAYQKVELDRKDGDRG